MAPVPEPVPLPEPPARPPVEIPVPETPEAPEAEKEAEAYEPVPPGVFESRSYYPQTEVTEWTMTGGARLVFRPLRTAPRQLALYAFAPSGFAAVPDSLSRSAYAAAILAGGGSRVTAAIEAHEVVLLGASSTDALGTLLTHVRTALLAPSDPADPASRPVEEALDAALAGHPPTVARAGAEARAVYERLFGDPRLFTFVLAGDATPELIEQEAARVLPRMRPSLQALLTPADTDAAPVRLPATAERWTLSPGTDRPALALAFRGRLEPSYDALAALDVLAALLAEEIGEGVHASAAVHFTQGVGEVRLKMEGEGAAAPDAEEAILDVVRALRATPPSDRAVASARGRLRAAHEERLETPEGWAAWLARLYRYDQDTREALRYGRRLSGVTPERVHRMARAVLDPGQFVLVRRPAD